MSSPHHSLESTPPLDPAPLLKGRTIGAYTLVKQIGQGGMASVWLAQRTDGEIQQRVAVKLPATEYHPEWRGRFLRERQLLASLNHPSIVHMIDAGHTPGGRPYLVMEYVDGAPIDVFSAGIPFRARLELFLRVCEGVAYAHRHLVIHRDLKPSNILVDRTGQPKLLDFGIAKLLDDPGDPAQTVARLFTPSYASPEQLSGAPQTTATDVYALGAVLYKLLTGRLPYEPASETSGAFAAVTGSHKIPSPSRLNPALPSDIDHILRKALRAEPDERYPSADAFANEIRALLDSRPVQARAGDAWYRTRKFLRRNWMPVAAAALLVSSLSTGLYVTNRERAVAQHRFQQLRKFAHTFVFDLHDDLAKLEGSTNAREMTVRAGLQYLDSLAKEAGGDLQLQKEIAAGYLKLGDAEGFPTKPNLGRIDDALASYRKAGDIYVRIAARDVAYLPDLASYYLKYASLVRFTRDLKRARDLAESAVQTYDRLRARRHLDAQSELDYVAAWGTLGDMDEDLGRYRQAWKDYTRCRELALARLNAKRDRTALNIVSQADERIGTAAQELGLLTEALRAFDEDESMLGELLAPDPRSPRFQRRRALVDHYRAGLYYNEMSANLGDAARALESATRYRDRAEDMVRSDPNDASALLSRAIAEYQVAFCLRESDPKAAVLVARNSVRLFDELIASGKTGYLFQSRRSRAMVGLGQALLSAGRTREALTSAESALAGERQIAGKDAAESEEHSLLVSALLLAGNANAASGNFDRAESLFQEARDQARSIAKQQGLENMIPLAGAEQALGAFYARRHRTAEARACYRSLVDLWQRFPDRSEYVDRQNAAAAGWLAALPG